MQVVPQVLWLKCLESIIDVSPLTVEPETLLLDAIALMAKQGKSTLVGSGAKILGWLTEKDVVKLVASGIDLKTTKISEVMHPLTIMVQQSELEDLATVQTQLRQSPLGLLLVVDEQSQLIGTITKESIYQLLDTDISQQQTALCDRQLTLEALPDREQRLGNLLQTSSDLIWEVDKNGIYTYVSSTIRDILGYEPEAALGKSPLEFMPLDRQQSIAKDFAAIFITPQPQIHQNGHLVWLETSGVPIFDSQGKFLGYRGNSRDIIQRQQAEASLQDTQQMLQAILDNSPAVIYVIDTKNKYLLINRQYEELFNIKQEQIFGKSIYDIWSQDIADQFVVHNHQVMTDGNSTATEEVVPHADGLHTYLSIKFTLKDANGLNYAICGISTDITQRKLAEEGLRLGDRAIAASSNGIIIADASIPNGPIIYVNSAYEQMTGYSAAEVMGQSFCLFSNDEINPQDLQQLNAAMQAGQDCTVLIRNYRRDRGVAWHELNISPVYDATGTLTHYIGIQTDITKRQQAETALLVSQQRLQYLLTATPAVIYTCKLSGDFGTTFISENVTAMMGYEPREFLKDSGFWARHIHPDDVSDVLSELSQAVERGHYTLNYRFLHQNGNYRWVYDTGRLVRDEAGNSVEFVGYWADITEQKQLEQELILALEKEKELNDLKSRFISMTSHEFRTPLSTILSSAELLEHYRHKWTQEKQLTHLRRIQTAVKRMTEMLQDVLFIGKAEAGILEFKPTGFDLVQYCGQLLQEVKLDLNNQRQISFSSQPEVIPCVMDEKLLGHILSNLLTNALKYSPSDSNVEFNLSCQDGQVIFEIQDQGIGILSADLPHLFESFHRGSNVDNILGTGLGLAIVKRCVDMHQGKIVVDSTLGVGTKVTVTLPLKKQIQPGENYDKNISN